MSGRLPRVPRLGAVVSTFSNGGGMFVGHPLGVAYFTGGSAYFGFTLDADGEMFAAIFRIPKTGTLSKVHFRTGTTTTGDDLKVSFQDVSATTGDPDGTADEFRVITIADGDDNAWKSTGIISSDGTDSGTKRSVTRGDLIAINWEFDSFVAGNLQLSILVGSGAVVPEFGYTYNDHKTTGSWAKHNNSLPLFALEYDDGTFAYIPGVIPAKSADFVTYNNTDTPDEIGLLFQLPFKCKVGGAWMGGQDIDGDTDLVLYDSDGTTVLETVSLDKDIRAATSGIKSYVWFSNDHGLLADTNYRLVLKPTSATDMTYREWTVDAAAQLDQMEGGQKFHRTERTDAGSWTETTTKRPLMGLIVTGA